MVISRVLKIDTVTSENSMNQLLKSAMIMECKLLLEISSEKSFGKSGPCLEKTNIIKDTLDNEEYCWELIQLGHGKVFV